MSWARIKELRAESVERMSRNLAEMEQDNLPAYTVAPLVVLGVIALILWQAARCFFGMLRAGVAAALLLAVTPFVFLYLFVDIAIIAVWHGRAVYEKLTGGAP